MKRLRDLPEEIFVIVGRCLNHLTYFADACDVFVENTVANKPCRSSLSVTACEPTAMSEAVVMEPPRTGGFLESSCGAGSSAASLDDGIVDTAKYVQANTSKTQ